MAGRGGLSAVQASLRERRERSLKRRRLLCRELGAGAAELGDVLNRPDSARNAATLPEAASGGEAPRAAAAAAGESGGRKGGAGGAEEEEEEVYQDSAVFLKGTQSANPHNDYQQHFVNTGQRPQNSLRDSSREDRFQDLPKLKDLIDLKDQLIRERATPPMYLKADLKTFDLRDLGTQFDVLLIDPPLPEYERRAPGIALPTKPWDWVEITALKIGSLAAHPSFCFLWVGASEGLDKGRTALRRWGYRRCEDICWIKTNKLNPGNTKTLEDNAVLQHTKEHCLMGIKGSLKRSLDTHIIHANLDIDIICAEEPEYGSTAKPAEIFNVIEHFCNGRRRLHLFASDSTLRPGWVSVGPEMTSSNYDARTYLDHFQGSPPKELLGKPLSLEGRPNTLLGCWPRIEELRPKSPPPRRNGKGKGRGGNSGRGGGRGRGRGRGKGAKGARGGKR